MGNCRSHGDSRPWDDSSSNTNEDIPKASRRKEAVADCFNCALAALVENEISNFGESNATNAVNKKLDAFREHTKGMNITICRLASGLRVILKMVCVQHSLQSG